MSIPLSPAVTHPTQPNVMLNKLAVESLVLSNGSSIDAPASIVVTLRPYADCVVNGVAGYISAPNIGTLDLTIPDLYVWINARAQLGDMQPANAMAALVGAIGAEYARQHA
jgi:hypothetical protein